MLSATNGLLNGRHARHEPGSITSYPSRTNVEPNVQALGLDLSVMETFLTDNSSLVGLREEGVRDDDTGEGAHGYLTVAGGRLDKCCASGLPSQGSTFDSSI
jgi:hypothetical protein